MFTTSGTGSDALGNTTHTIFIPASVNLASTDRFLPIATGGNVQVRLTLSGGVTCTYQAALPTSGSPIPAPPLPFYGTTCSNGTWGPGSAVTVFTATLSGSRPTLEDTTFHASVGLAYDIDDGNPCTNDICTSGTISHSPLPDNTVVGGVSGDACNGVIYCITGGPQNGAPMSADDGNPCTTDSCSNGAISNASNGTCSQPSGAATYPGGGAVPSDFSQGMQFLFAAQGVTLQPSGAMDAKRLAIIRGRVIDRDSASPVAATISILNHSEFGTTTTRTDGFYDIVVNGGAPYVVQFTASGYLTAQRPAQTRWLDWTVIPDVGMVTPDPSTSVTLGSGSWQWVQGAQKSDLDGPRKATVLIPPSTTITSCAGATYCSGSTWTGGNSVTMHATEFTVGNGGIKAMPGTLPSQSAYTYAVDTGLLDAAHGYQPIDTNVTFSAPVLFYVENFTGADLDTTNGKNAVPTGSYDKLRGVWQAEANGKVYCIIGLAGGIAHLGLDCTNELTSYGGESPPISSGERTTLATVYSAATFPKQVWRVGLPHFSTFDCNWTSGPPSDGPTPPNIRPTVATAKDKVDCSAVLPGSIIECQNQVLGEAIPIAGTPYALHYRSETQNGYHPTITVPYTDDKATIWTDPPIRIEIEVDIAGQSHSFTLSGPYQNDQSINYAWDRNDVYGRPVQGAVNAQVQVRYVYHATPTGKTPVFGIFGVGGTSLSGSRAQREITITRQFQVVVDAFDAKPLGFGGWTIDAQSVYEPVLGTLWLGNGTKQQANEMASTLHTLYTDPNGGGAMWGMATTADGQVFAQDNGNSRLIQFPAGIPITSSLSSNATMPAPPATKALSSVYSGGMAVARAGDGGLLIDGVCGVIHVDYPAMTARLLAGALTTNQCNGNVFAADCATPGRKLSTSLRHMVA